MNQRLFLCHLYFIFSSRLRIRLWQEKLSSKMGDLSSLESSRHGRSYLWQSLQIRFICASWGEFLNTTRVKHTGKDQTKWTDEIDRRFKTGSIRLVELTTLECTNTRQLVVTRTYALLLTFSNMSALKETERKSFPFILDHETRVGTICCAPQQQPLIYDCKPEHHSNEIYPARDIHSQSGTTSSWKRLVPAYSVTTHKSQAQTLPKIIIDLNMPPGVVEVAYS